MVDALYEEVSGSEVTRPGWDLARVTSYALALLMHAGTLALVVAAGLLLWTDVNVVTVIAAAVLLTTAFLVAPRFGRLRGQVRLRTDAPALFRLIDRIGAEIGARPVHAVVVTGAFNAAYGTVGLRRRRVLELGLPLWDTLTEQQRVAVLGHELAHGVNGDSRHGLVAGTSLSTLARLHHALRPGGRDRRMNYLVDLSARLLQAVAGSVVSLVYRIQRATTLRAGQRAEYLAARVASPVAAVDALDAVVTTADSHATAVRRHALTQRKTDFWADRRQALTDLPEHERERRRLRVDESHPPTHLRIAVLRSRPDAEARVRLEAGESGRIQAELTPDYARVAGELRECARAALYR
ncbi:M48 family metallopeptidase [Actinomadura sp. DC4]|uniref:M48 family metallopeptidase n=1 Tax=Actinomadura sp. DC4 TaxID=3055069 RepID=UPI0025AF4B56|nr:M48 family metallopeptidase [Actinomadura sp. DC4]MDN3356880.1 M48 family metalloprotease [Actinomadura sp. DC4]